MELNENRTDSATLPKTFTSREYDKTKGEGKNFLKNISFSLNLMRLSLYGSIQITTNTSHYSGLEKANLQEEKNLVR